MASVYYLYPFSLFMWRFLEFSTSVIFFLKKDKPSVFMVSQKTSRYKNPLAFMKDTKRCKCPSVSRHILFQRSDSWGQKGSKQGRQPLLTNGVEVTGVCGRCVLLWSLEGWAIRPWVPRGVTGLWPRILLILVLTSHSSRWTWRGKCISWCVVKSWKFLEKEDSWEAPTPESERWVRNCVLLKFVSSPPPKSVLVVKSNWKTWCLCL